MRLTVSHKIQAANKVVNVAYGWTKCCALCPLPCRYTNMKALRILIISFAILSSPLSQAEEQKSCKTHPLVSGSCFEVRGRLAFYNGSPSMRIWPIGTNRLLGISEGKYFLEGYANIPSVLVSQLKWGYAIYANFVACPFTKQARENMQLVCVESATNVQVKPWP
jgi:hypothetical protein